MRAGAEGVDSPKPFNARHGIYHPGGTWSVTIPGEGSCGGTLAVTGPGVLRATPAPPDLHPPFDLYLNASKDIMIGAVAEPGFNELLILLKAPASGAQHDLQGHWPFVSYNTPSEVSLLHTGMGEVTGVTNAMNFEAVTGFLNIQANGGATIVAENDPDTIAITWVGSPDRRLQQLSSVAPVTWADVPGTLGQSSVTLPREPDTTLFHVAEN